MARPPGLTRQRPAPGPYADLVADLRALGQREAAEIAARFPKVQRRVGGTTSTR